MKIYNRNMNPPLAMLFFTSIIALTVSGCSSCRDKDPLFSSLNILLDSSVISEGETLQLTVEGILEDGTELNSVEMFEEFEDAHLEWASSDEDKAIIDVEGLLTSLAAGTVTITATFYPYGEDDTEDAISGSVEITIEGRPVISSIQVSPATFSIPVDGTKSLIATGQYENGETEDITDEVIWESSDPGIISISESGIATGISAGMSNITATYEEIISNVAVGTVTEANLISIQLQPPTGQLYAGSSSIIQITAQGVYDDHSTADLTQVANWESSDDDIATVSNADGRQGEVSAGNETGTALITAAYDGVESSPSVIQVLMTQEVVSISVEPADESIALGTSLEFDAIATYADGRTGNVSQDAIWTSDDSSVVTMAGAIATGVGEGTAIITAAFEGEEGYANLEVTTAELISIEIDPSVTSIARGTTQQFTAIGLFSDTSTQDITSDVSWTTGDAAIATIDSDGLATGESIGTVTITATMGDISQSASLVVTADEINGIMIVDESDVEISEVDLHVQGTVHVRAMATLTNGSTQDITPLATWASMPDTTASVSSYGVITGLSGGQATVTASYQGFDAEITVNVSGAVLVSLQITPTLPDSLPVGLSIQFTAIGTYSDDETQDFTDHDFVTWTSSSEDIATISNAPDSKGEATGISEGGTQIRAVYDDGAGTMIESDAVILNVVQPALVDISVEPETATVIPSFDRQFEAFGNYTDGSTQDLTSMITWTTSDNSVATISNVAGKRGLATGEVPGTVTVYADLPGSGVDPGEATLVVEDARLVSIAVTPAFTSVARGESKSYTATGLFSNGENIDLTSHVEWDVEWAGEIVPDPLNKPVINNNGNLTTISGVNPTEIGTYVVVAEHDGTDRQIRGSARLTVTTERALYNITVEVAGREGADPYTMPDGWTAQLVATGHYCPDPRRVTGAVCNMDTSEWSRHELTEDLTDVVTWASTDTDVFTVDNAADRKGLLSAIAEGDAWVRLTYQGQTYQNRLQIFVVEDCTPFTVLICPAGQHPADAGGGCGKLPVDSQNLPRGGERRLGAMAYFDGACASVDSQDVTGASRWTSVNTAVATVNNVGNKGLVTVSPTAEIDSEVIINARFPSPGGILYEKNIRVGEPCIISITFNPDNVTYPASGLMQQFGMIAQMSDLTTHVLDPAETPFMFSFDQDIISDCFITPDDYNEYEDRYESFRCVSGMPGETVAHGIYSGQSPYRVCDLEPGFIEFEAAVTVGEFSAETQSHENDPLVSMEIIPDNVTIVRGGHYDLQAIAHFASGAIHDVTHQIGFYGGWNSYPENRASFVYPPSGRIVADKERDGQVVVTATLGPLTATGNVNITGQELAKVNIAFGEYEHDECTDDDGRYPVGVKIPLKATAFMSDWVDEYEDVTSGATWESSNPGIVQISADGKARMMAAGRAYIHAVYGGLSSAVACSSDYQCNDSGGTCHNNLCYIKIDVFAPETNEYPKLELGSSQCNGTCDVYTGSTISMRAYYEWADEKVCDVTGLANWTATNARILHLGNGVFRGVSAGTPKPEAKAEFKTLNDKKEINVLDSDQYCIADISRNPSTINIAEGATVENIEITGWLDQNGNEIAMPGAPVYRWSSLDEVINVEHPEGMTTDVTATGKPGESAVLTAVLKPHAGYNSCHDCESHRDCAHLGDIFECDEGGTCLPGTEIIVNIVDAEVSNHEVKCYNISESSDHSPAIEKEEIAGQVPRGVIIFCEAEGTLTNTISGNVSEHVSWEVTPSPNLEIVSVESDGVLIRTKAAGNANVNAIVGSTVKDKSLVVTTENVDVGIYDAYGNSVSEIGAVNGYTGRYYMHMVHTSGVEEISYDATDLANWSSGNNSIVTVTDTEPKGIISVLGQSTSNVTVSAANVGLTATMSVKTAGMSYSSFEVCADVYNCADSFDVGKGQERQLYAYVTYNGIKMDVTAQTTWTSLDTNSMTVVDGMIEGIDEGTISTLTAQYLTEMKEVQIEVTNACVDEIEVNVENQIGQPLIEIHRNMPFYVSVAGNLSDGSDSIDVTGDDITFEEVRCDDEGNCEPCSGDCYLVGIDGEPRVFDHIISSGQSCNTDDDCNEPGNWYCDDVCRTKQYYFVVKYDLSPLPAEVHLRAVYDEASGLMCPGIDRLEEMTEGLEITEADLLSIEVLPADEYVPIGESQTYQARGHFSSGHQFDMTRRVFFYTTDEKIASFQENSSRLLMKDNEDNLGFSTWVVAEEIFEFVDEPEEDNMYGTHAGYTSVTASEGVLQQIILAGKFTKNNDCGGQWIFDAEAMDLILPVEDTYIEVGAGREKMYIAPEGSLFEHPKGGYTTFVRAIGVYSGGITYRDLTSEVNWSVNGPANVDEFGRVTTGGAAGTAEFTASFNNMDDQEINLAVIDGTISIIELVPAIDVDVPLGLQYQMGSQGFFGSNRYCLTHDVSWSVVDGDEYCLILAEEPGRVETLSTELDAEGEHVDSQCVVHAELGTFSREGNVFVVAPLLVSVEVIPNSFSLYVGDVAQLQAIGWYTDGTWDYVTEDAYWVAVNPDREWFSDVVQLEDSIPHPDYPGIPVYFASGWLEAINTGIATVVACVELDDDEICSHIFFDEEENDWITDWERYSATITVERDPSLVLEQLSIIPTYLEMDEGERYQLIAIGWYTDGTWDYLSNVAWFNWTGNVELDDNPAGPHPVIDYYEWHMGIDPGSWHYADGWITGVNEGFDWIDACYFLHNGDAVCTEGYYSFTADDFIQYWNGWSTIEVIGVPPAP